MSAARRRPSSRQSKRPLIWIAVAAAAGLVGLAILSALRPPQPTSGAASPTGTNHGASMSTNAPASTNAADLAAAFAALPDEDKVASLLSHGSELLAAGDYAAALRAYQAALQIKKDDEDIHFNTGIALARLGRTNEAIRAYREALSLFPDYAEVHNNLGNLLASQGKTAEAISHFNAALKASPESASAHNNLGSVLARQGELQKALEHFEQASRLNTNYLEAHYNLANTYLELGKADLAVDKFTEILRQQPDFKPAQAGLQRARARLTGAKP